MASLEDVLGIDVADPEFQRALVLVENDRKFLRSLIEMRRQRKLSQADLAEVLGIQQPTISAFERHDSDPRLSTLRRYALAVGAHVEHRVSEDARFAMGRTWDPVGATITSVQFTSGGVHGQENFTPGDSSRADFALSA